MHVILISGLVANVLEFQRTGRESQNQESGRKSKIFEQTLLGVDDLFIDIDNLFVNSLLLAATCFFCEILKLLGCCKRVAFRFDARANLWLQATRLQRPRLH